MINKLQTLKDKLKLKIRHLFSKYYDELIYRKQSGNFQFEEDPFSKSVQGIAKIIHEGLLLSMNFLQTKA